MNLLLKQCFPEAKTCMKKVIFQGEKYQDTSHVCCPDLRFYIERDIHLAIKTGEIPDLDYNVKISYYGDITVYLSNVKGSVLNIKHFSSLSRYNEPGLHDYLHCSDPEELIEKNNQQIYTRLGHEILYKVSKILSNYNFEEYQMIKGGITKTDERFCPQVSYSRSYLNDLLKKRFILNENESVF